MSMLIHKTVPPHPRALDFRQTSVCQKNLLRKSRSKILDKKCMRAWFILFLCRNVLRVYTQFVCWSTMATPRPCSWAENISVTDSTSIIDCYIFGKLRFSWTNTYSYMKMEYFIFENVFRPGARGCGGTIILSTYVLRYLTTLTVRA